MQRERLPKLRPGHHIKAEGLSEAQVLGAAALLAPEDREVSLIMVAHRVAVDVIPAALSA